jgi:ferric-dicitrate binding protein FerR (iron transport regulator)
MEVDSNVVRRYFEGIEREGDKDLIVQWFSDIQYEKDLGKKYRLLWDELNENEEIEKCNGSVILGRIFHQMKRDEYRELPKKRGLVRVLNVVSRIAAVLFIPLVIWLWTTKSNNYSVASEQAYSEVFSPLGTRTMFYLPDGSSGWLNGGSYLRFPVEFTGKTRDVELRGEGYFDVKTNKKQPFVVKGKRTETTAYGTSFNIQAYPEDPEIRITLINGNIKITERNNRKTVALPTIKPGQMFTYVQDTRSLQIEKVNTDLITAWKDGKLTFRDENFVEIVKRINRWYNVDIRIKDEVLKSYNYQATFQDETLDEVLKLLQYSSPLRYVDLGRERRVDGTFEKRKIELYYKPH